MYSTHVHQPQNYLPASNGFISIPNLEGDNKKSHGNNLARVYMEVCLLLLRPLLRQHKPACRQVSFNAWFDACFVK
jgi:hypothetical protein